MIEAGSNYKKKVQKGIAFDRKGVPSTKLRFAERDIDGNFINVTFVTPGSYPCEKTDGFEFTIKSIEGVYLWKKDGYTNVNVYGKAEVYDKNGNLIGSVDQDAEEQFREVTGMTEDLPF